jgi:hypothetical protein
MLLTRKDIRMFLRNLAVEGDVVVSINRGGTVPGRILASKINAEHCEIHLRLYEDGMKPKRIYKEPKLKRDFSCNVNGKDVILVDDLCRTGDTINKAKEILKKKGARNIKTLVLVTEDRKMVDFYLYESKECPVFPWTKMKKTT